MKTKTDNSNWISEEEISSPWVNDACLYRKDDGETVHFFRSATEKELDAQPVDIESALDHIFYQFDFLTSVIAEMTSGPNASGFHGLLQEQTAAARNLVRDLNRVITERIGEIIVYVNYENVKAYPHRPVHYLDAELIQPAKKTAERT